MHRRLTQYAPIGLVICSAIAGCNRAPGSSAPAPSASLGASPIAIEPSRHETAPAPQNPRDFGAMFQNESANRPTGTITAESAIAAFRTDGIALESVRQHLGRPYGARYCVGATSGAAVALSVCEYIDAQAAKTGAEVSRKIALPNREIRINQATSLTIREIQKTPAADAIKDKLFASFAKLSS